MNRHVDAQPEKDLSRRGVVYAQSILEPQGRPDIGYHNPPPEAIPHETSS